MRRGLYAMCKALKAPASSARTETTALQIFHICTIENSDRKELTAERQKKTSRAEGNIVEPGLTWPLTAGIGTACDVDGIKLNQQIPIPVSNLAGFKIAENP